MGVENYKWVRHGRDRYVGSPNDKIGENFWNGFEIQNI